MTNQHHEKRHPEYSAMLPLWNRCRNLFQGEDAVKKNSESNGYLPRPEGMEHWAYHEYVVRATLPGIFESTVNGRLGDIFRKSPIYTGPDELTFWLQNVNSHQESIDIIASRVLRELMVTGRCALLLDYHDDEQAFHIHLYKAEDILHWDARKGSQSVMLRELSFDPNEEYDPDLEEHLHLYIEEGVYKAIRYKRDTQKRWLEEELNPSRFGGPIDFMPLIVINNERLGYDVNEPPMLNLSNLLLSYFRNSADYEQGLHAIGVPTPYVTGIRESEAVFMLGPYTPIILEPPDAKVGYLEFQGSGMTHLKEAMEEKLVQAVMMGARLLQPRRQVESAEAAHTRMGAETSVLNSLVRVTELGIQRMMEYWMRWNGMSLENAEYSYTLNRDFIEESLDPNVLRIINESEMNGHVSPQAAFNLRKKLEVYEDGVTFEEEQDNIRQLGSNIFDPNETSETPS